MKKHSPVYPLPDPDRADVWWPLEEPEPIGLYVITAVGVRWNWIWSNSPEPLISIRERANADLINGQFDGINFWQAEQYPFVYHCYHSADLEVNEGGYSGSAIHMVMRTGEEAVIPGPWSGDITKGERTEGFIAATGVLIREESFSDLTYMAGEIRKEVIKRLFIDYAPAGVYLLEGEQIWEGAAAYHYLQPSVDPVKTVKPEPPDEYRYKDKWRPADGSNISKRKLSIREKPD